MESATILQWYKGEGEAVQKGEPVLEVMTDKINIDIEADASGVLLKQVFQAETEVPVNTVIGYIGVEGETVKPAETGAHAETLPVNEQNDKQQNTQTEPTLVTPSTLANRPRATPSARRLAQMHGVDLRQLAGSGPRNRIQKVDVEQYVQTQLQAQEAVHSDSPVREVRVRTGVAGEVGRSSLPEGERASLVQPAHGGATRIPVTGMRKVVGERMASSAFSAPHVTLTSEVNLAETVRLRNRLLPVIESQTKQRLSYTELIILAVARTLRRNPLLNASFHEDFIELHNEIHIGMAVAVSNGLVVPVVQHADQKGLAQIVEECKSLAKAARENQLRPENLSGGTFTVSNLGMYRVDAFTPIINKGETAILGVGRVVEKPVVNSGAVEVQPMMMLSLSFDHRVVDGVPAAQFLTDLTNALENPDQLIL